MLVSIHVEDSCFPSDVICFVCLGNVKVSRECKIVAHELGYLKKETLKSQCY